MTATPLGFGEALPHLLLRSSANPRYSLGTVAGRYVLLAVLPSSRHPDAAALEAAIAAHRARFDDANACLFLISADPADEDEGRLRDHLPGIRALWDPEQQAATALRFDPRAGGLLLADPMLRIIATAPLAAAASLLGQFASLPTAAQHAGIDLPAPVLILPRVFEPGFCRDLIAQYEQAGGTPSGFMREIDGRTRLVTDPTHKKRADAMIEDAALQGAIRARLRARLIPMIEVAFQFKATRIERYIVACYDAAEGGHFRAHRDNTTKGTAHRRFAVTINLNAEEYEGGDLCFPEFGPRSYRAPTGGAVVFSCSLLHEARPVTRGRRYACLPFLYDEAAAQIRDANRQFIEVTAPALVN